MPSSCRPPKPPHERSLGHRVPRPSPASTRVVELLNFLAAHPGESFRLSELARRVGFNKATAHGMLAVLADAEYLVYDPADKTFSLGPSVIELSMSAIRYESKLAAFAQEEMEALAKAVGAQCLANTIVGDEFLVIATAGEPAAGAAGTELGYRGRLVPPIGMVFHAWASDAVIDRWLDRASADAGERIRYRKLLSAVRERGFSVSADRETRGRLEQALAQLREGNGAADVRGTLTELIADISRDEHELVEIVPEQSAPRPPDLRAGLRRPGRRAHGPADHRPTGAERGRTAGVRGADRRGRRSRHPARLRRP